MEPQATPAKKTTGRQEESRRKLILDAAAQCVVEEGIEGATLRRIAERANVSTGMLFYYYANKKELITAALETASQHLAAQIDSLAGDEPRHRRIEVLFELLFTERAPEMRPWPFWMEYWSAASRNPDFNEDHKQFIGMRSRLTKWIEDGSKEGSFPSDIDSSLAATLLSALLVGLGIHTTLDRNVPPDRALEVANLAIALLRGVGKGQED